jgi:hypothetical protein
MKIAKTFLLSITLLALLGLIVAMSSAKPTPTIVIPPDLQGAEPGTIDEMVFQALSNGETLAKNGLIGEHEAAHTFDEAKASYSVLLATANSQNSVQTSPFSIATWTRFTLTETLSVVAPHVCVSGVCAPPTGIAAAGSTELLVPKPGGTIFKNGVEVDLRLEDFPDFVAGQNYLLFVDYDPASRVGAPAIGELGVFVVNSNGTVTALVASSDLKNDIATRFGNSLSQIRTALGAPPSGGGSCNPTAEQFCYSRNGEWDSTTCTCFVDPCLMKPWLCE